MRSHHFRGKADLRRISAPEGPRPTEFTEAPDLAEKRAKALEALGSRWLLHPANAVKRRK